jgi:Tfp pilus assembly protein PilX
MNRITASLRRAQGQSEAGFALIMVLGIGLVILIISTAAIGLSISNIQKSRGDQDFAAAESAAYAGIADYETKLSNNNTYYIYGNPSSSFSPSGTVTLPPTTNAAFSIGAGGSTGYGTWATVPGGDGTAMYRYEVDNSKYASTGIIRLRATGRAGTSVRSLVVNVKQHGFVDFMYFTNYELQDPAQTNASCIPTYDWQTAHSSLCNEIQFAPSDVINGPVHSNDTIKVCGSTFTQGFTSSDPVSPYYETPSGCSAASFPGGNPTRSATVDMPPTNSQMRQEVRSDLTGSTVPNPGCLYTGPTSVIFNSDGTMTVRSPFTKATEVALDTSTGLLSIGSTPAQCGPVGNVANGLGSTGGATISVLNSNLMFVQDVPSSTGDPSNPNAWLTTAYPTGFTCSNTSSLSGWKFGSLAYPMANETVPAATPVHYGCRKGDVYTNGVMHGTMTITADNYIYVTGDVTYANNITDMLGLVGTNAIWVWNPFNGSTPLLGSDRTISAAMLSLRHTFQVQNYTLGASPRGILTLNGAIAQQFRGTVGQSSSGNTITQGYSKNYNYDKRLQFMAPPKFLSPVSASYGISQVVEVSSPFNSDGSYK